MPPQWSIGTDRFRPQSIQLKAISAGTPPKNKKGGEIYKPSWPSPVSDPEILHLLAPTNANERERRQTQPPKPDFPPPIQLLVWFKELPIDTPTPVPAILALILKLGSRYDDELLLNTARW